MHFRLGEALRTPQFQIMLPLSALVSLLLPMTDSLLLFGPSPPS